MKSEIVSLKTAKAIIKLQEQNKILQEKLNDAREYISTQKNEIKKLKNLCDKYEEEHKITFNQWESDISKYQTLKNLQQIIDKAIGYVKRVCENENNINPYTLHAPTLLNILEDKDE